MRWERLFGELEGYAEHLRLEERDALVTDLREGEWAERSWIDTLAGGEVEADVAVVDVGVLAGRVRMANELVIHLETSTAVQVIAASAVQWVRSDGRPLGLDRDSVAAKLGWGPVFREALDEGDAVRLTLAGGLSIEGVVSAVGSDFVRITVGDGRHRDVPTSAIRMATFPK
jgi:hypothetical protein